MVSKSLFLLIFLVCSSMLPGNVFAQFSNVINIPPDSDPGVIESNVQLNLMPFGTLGSNFDAGEFNGTSINVEVNISGGSIGDFFTANRGSTVNINGGLFGDFFNARIGSDVNINGGTIGDSFNAADSCDVTITGGTVGSGFAAFFGSSVTIVGGQIGNHFLAASSSNVELVGQNFELRDIDDGSLIQDLTPLMQPGTPFPLSDRDVTLIGLLADGSPFEFDLNSVFAANEDFFSADAELRLTLTIATAPSALDVFRGMALSGGLPEILSSDNSRLSVIPGFTLSSIEAPVTLVIDGTLQLTAVNSLLLSVESQAGSPGLTATVEAFNWTASTFNVITTFDESFNTDSISTANLSSNTSDFIQSGSGAVRARIGWRQTGFIINFPWEIRVDQISWAIN